MSTFEELLFQSDARESPMSSPGGSEEAAWPHGQQSSWMGDQACNSWSTMLLDSFTVSCQLLHIVRL